MDKSINMLIAYLFMNVGLLYMLINIAHMSRRLQSEPPAGKRWLGVRMAPHNSQARRYQMIKTTFLSGAKSWVYGHSGNIQSFLALEVDAMFKSLSKSKSI